MPKNKSAKRVILYDHLLVYEESSYEKIDKTAFFPIVRRISALPQKAGSTNTLFLTEDVTNNFIKSRFLSHALAEATEPTYTDGYDMSVLPSICFQVPIIVNPFNWAIPEISGLFN